MKTQTNEAVTLGELTKEISKLNSELLPKYIIMQDQTPNEVKPGDLPPWPSYSIYQNDGDGLLTKLTGLPDSELKEFAGEHYDEFKKTQDKREYNEIMNELRGIE